MRCRSSLLIVALIVAGCAQWEPCAVEIGWTGQQVIDHCGKPQDMSTSAYETGKIVIWAYHYYDALLGYRPDIARVYVTFRNGKVVGVKY